MNKDKINMKLDDISKRARKARKEDLQDIIDAVMSIMKETADMSAERQLCVMWYIHAALVVLTNEAKKHDVCLRVGDGFDGVVRYLDALCKSNGVSFERMIDLYILATNKVDKNIEEDNGR